MKRIPLMHNIFFLRQRLVFLDGRRWDLDGILSEIRVHESLLYTFIHLRINGSGRSGNNTTPPLAPVKAVEETCVTCGGAHPYYQCLAAGDNSFSELKDNIQGYVLAAAVKYNQGNPGYRPPSMANQIRPPGFAQPNVQNDQN
nr:hypothetical protein [Tanacetum cinerariifolium]